VQGVFPSFLGAGIHAWCKWKLAGSQSVFDREYGLVNLDLKGERSRFDSNSQRGRVAYLKPNKKERINLYVFYIKIRTRPRDEVLKKE